MPSVVMLSVVMLSVAAPTVTCSNDSDDDVADVEGPLVEEEPPLSVRQNVLRQNAVRTEVGHHTLGGAGGVQGAADDVSLKKHF